MYLLITVKEKVHLKKKQFAKSGDVFLDFLEKRDQWNSFWSQIFKLNVLDWFTVLIHPSRINKHSVLSLLVFSLILGVCT